MDMAVANLFKHNVHFRLDSEERDTNERYLNSKGRQYRSKDIENLQSVGVRNANDLCLKCVEPFIVHIISTIVNEERDHIDNITVRATIIDISGTYTYQYEHILLEYNLDNPKYCLHLFSSNGKTTIYSFRERVLNGPFFIHVNAFYYFIPPHLREVYINEWLEAMRAARRIPIEEDDYTPLDEAYRQDRCVICLESTPNILYLDCMHIAVCDSCDRMKRTVMLRKNCDICRSEISRRIKI